MAVDQSTISADQALSRLIAGNERYLRGTSVPTPLHETMNGLQHHQQPFATILGCSDSRVPPEIIFDTELGELFVIRVAGNVFSPEIDASLQYAAAHLHTQLFVVLGHEGCGVVNGALLTRDGGEHGRSKIQLLVNHVMPGLPPFNAQLSPAQRTAQAVESNVRWTVDQIVATPEAQSRLAEGKIKIVGALFEISTGRVRFFE
jgi:carbonic anhydrase